MKRTNIKLSFENDTVTAFRQPINLVVTKSGHYSIPITNNKQLLNDLNTTHQQITLTLTNNNSDKKKEVQWGILRQSARGSPLIE